MTTIEPIQIPDSFSEFAKAVADLAEAHGIDKFTMEFRQAFNQPEQADRRMFGDTKIVFSGVDGRGRPSRSLGIHVNAHAIHQILSEPTSE